ncbi:hypothetical protein K6Q96_17825 [Grimontia kaedaensis]|uniref:Uncharacterized protein n=1 Tax=Grimontia kaedaensis TaxID=2872157 RepID=A0ABY4X1G4_9GAMM|nr:hypothetical protein [Grimontia kaedaensis]USH05087.1 hypothetical protein K6Q96_17825 [Grimontia kaedaensis]
MPDFIYLILFDYLKNRERDEQNPADWRKNPSARFCLLRKSSLGKGSRGLSDGDKQKCADAYHPFVQAQRSTAP